MTYLSGCSDSLRYEKIEKWKYELNSIDFSFSKFMESECQILQWITEGLPSDETSHQNAIILKQVNDMQKNRLIYFVIIVNVLTLTFFVNRLKIFKFR